MARIFFNIWMTELRNYQVQNSLDLNLRIVKSGKTFSSDLFICLIYHLKDIDLRSCTHNFIIFMLLH